MQNQTEMEYQKVIDYIFELIRTGKLIVGSKIPSEREMAEKLGIGRNSTREAISIMRGMGFVESIHGSGNYISSDCNEAITQILSVMISLGRISNADLFAFRRFISISIANSVTKDSLSDESKKELEKILEKMDGAGIWDFIKLDKQFHKILISSNKNPLFDILMDPVAEVYLGTVRNVIENTTFEDRKKLIEIHRNIYNSFCNGDKESCVKYVEEHFEFAKENAKF